MSETKRKYSPAQRRAEIIERQMYINAQRAAANRKRNQAKRLAQFTPPARVVHDTVSSKGSVNVPSFSYATLERERKKYDARRARREQAKHEKPIKIHNEDPHDLHYTNNPYEINSPLDILFNTAALKENYGSANAMARLKALKDFNYSIVGNVFQGNWYAAVHNLMIAGNEVLDTADNVIKSITTKFFNDGTDSIDYVDAVEAVQKYKLGQYESYVDVAHNQVRYKIATAKTSFDWTDEDLRVAESIVNSGRTVNPYNLTWNERLKSSIGIGEHGRINYDYNTGSNLTDFTLEVVTGLWDTILTGGVRQLTESGVRKSLSSLDSIMNAGASTSIKKNMAAVAKLNKDKFITEVADLYKAGSVIADKSTDKAVLSALTGIAVKTKGVQQKFAIKSMSDAMTYTLVKHGIYDVSLDDIPAMKSLLDRAVTRNVNRMTLSVIKGTDNFMKVKDFTDKAGMYMSLSPLGLVAGLSHAATPGVAKWMDNKLKAAGLANSKDGVVTLESFFDNQHAMKQAAQVISDATGEKVEPASPFMQLLPAMVRDAAALRKILQENRANKSVDGALQILDYFKKTYQHSTLDEILEKAKALYVDTSEPLVKEYMDVLQEAKLYVLQVSKYKRTEALHTIAEGAKETITREVFAEDEAVAKFTVPRVLEVKQQTEPVAATKILMEDLDLAGIREVALEARIPKVEETVKEIAGQVVELVSKELSETQISKQIESIKTKLHAIYTEVDAVAAETVMDTIESKRIQASQKLRQGVVKDVYTTIAKLYSAFRSLGAVKEDVVELKDVTENLVSKDPTEFFTKYKELYQAAIDLMPHSTHILDDFADQLPNFAELDPDVQQMAMELTIADVINADSTTALAMTIINAPSKNVDAASKQLAYDFLHSKDAVRKHVVDSALRHATFNSARLKIQTAYSTEMLLYDPTVEYLMDSFSISGDIGELLAKIAADPQLNEEYKGDVEFLQHVFDGPRAYRHFLEELSCSEIPIAHQEAIVQTLQNFVYLMPEEAYSRFNNVFDAITKKSNDFLATTQQMNSYSLDAYLKDNLDKVNAFRAERGLAAITTEEHTALSDATVQEMLYNELVKDMPELANKKSLMFDMEAVNTTTNANTNTIWQIGFCNKDVQKEYTLKQEQFNSAQAPNMPYLQKLMGDTTSDYATLEAAWEKKYMAKGTEESEIAILTNFLQSVYEQAKDTKNGDVYDFVLAAHNGNVFDFNLLKAKVAYYKYNMPGALKVSDIDILDKVQLVDTLELWHKAENWDMLTASDLDHLKPLLFSYFSEAQNTDNRLFSSITYFETLQIEAAIKRMNRTEAGVNNLLIKDVESKILQNIRDVQDALYAVHHANEVYKVDNIDLDQLLDTSKDYSNLIQFLTDLGMPEELAQAKLRYAQTGKHFNLSAVLYGTELLYDVGYAYTNKPEIVLQYFNESLYEKLTVPQIRAVNTISRSLDRASQKVRMDVLHPETVAMFKAFLSKMRDNLIAASAIADPNERAAKYNPFSKTTEFVAYEAYKQLLDMPLWQYIRTDRLNGAQTVALVRYMFRNIYDTDPKLFMSKFVDTTFTDVAKPTLDTFKAQANIALNRKRINAASKWATADFNGVYDEYTAFEGIYQDLLNYNINLDEASQRLDKFGIAASAKQARLAAMQPVMQVVQIMKDYCSTLNKAQDYAGLQRLTHALYQMRNASGDKIARYALDSSTNLEHWLASSGGFIIVENEQLIKSLDTKLLAEHNIKVEQAGKDWVVYLTKDSGLMQHVTTSDTGVITLESVVNNTTYSHKFDWDVDTYRDTQELIGIPGLGDALEKLSRTVSFISDNAAAATTYEHMDLGVLKEIRSKLPQKVLDDMVDLPSEFLFQQNGFNHTILGSASLVNAWMGHASNDPIKMLCNASVNLAESKNSVTNYTLAMLNSTTDVQNTVLGKLILEDPVSAANWLKAHPEYTLAKLVPADNKLGYRVVNYSAIEAEQAIKQGAHLVTTNVFDKIYKVVNEQAYTNRFAKAWNAVERLFKIGYLVTPGTWVRNTLDAFIKTTVESDAPATDVIKAYGQAFRMYSDFSAITNQLIKNMPEGTTFSHYLDSFAVSEWFKSNGFTMDYEGYKTLYKFFQESAAGGEISTLTSSTNEARIAWLKALSSTQQADINDLVQQAEQQRIVNRVFGKALSGMNYTESIARLAQYNLMTSKGATFTETLQHISKTQFNYENKTPFEKKMEFVIPFFTFAERNLTFWMDMIERKPGFLETFQDVFAPLWNLDQYDHDELEDNTSLQNAIASGAIPTNYSADYFIKTNFSFMDALNILANPLKEIKEQTYAPVKAIINVGLQNLSDTSYHSGQEAVSNWIQNYFGTLPTKAQVLEKSKEWDATFRAKYLETVKVSSENPVQTLVENFAELQMMPLIGTTLNRLWVAGMYYIPKHPESLVQDTLKLGGYLTGVGGNVQRFDEEQAINLMQKRFFRLGDVLERDPYSARDVWRQVCEAHDIDPNQNLYSINYSLFTVMYKEFYEHYKSTASELYEVLQSDEDMPYLYSRLKWAMGYGDVPMGKLPNEVQQFLLETLQGEAPTEMVMPVISDNESLVYLWQSAKHKYGIENTPWEKIPTHVMNEIYKDITESVVVISKIHTLLEEDEVARYNYGASKNELGYHGFKLNQLPNEVLNIVLHDMITKPYGFPAKASTGSNGHAVSAPRARRHVTAPINALTPRQKNFQYNAMLWANYSHNSANKYRHAIYAKQYLNNRNVPGVTNRIKSSVTSQINPTELKYRLKDMYYYFRD